MKLDTYNNIGFDRGRSVWVETLWIVVQALFVDCWLPGSLHRVWLLRLFGARLGQGVIIKQFVRVKFPWKLVVGDHSWIGEGVWIDNLAVIRLGNHVCISQGAYLCTGSHDWSSKQFDLIVRPIEIHDHAWVAARAVVAPGVCIYEGAVLGLGSVATSDLDAWHVYCGCPAVLSRERKLHGDINAI